MKLLVGSAALLILLASCQESGTPETPVQPTTELLDYRKAPRFHNNPKIYPPGFVKEDDRDPETMLAASRMYDAYYYGGQTLEERHHSVLSFRDSMAKANSRVPFFLLDQSASATVIGNLVMETYMAESPPQWSQAELEVIGYHVDALIKHRVPQPIILMPALEWLEGHWPAQRLSESARSTAAITKAWLATDPHGVGDVSVAESPLGAWAGQAIQDLEAFADRME